METVIDILDFSDDPWGRTYEDNPTSNGNAFRTAFLTDAFRKYDKVTVDFPNYATFPILLSWAVHLSI